ncbi:MAG: TfoX/Sxy family protein [Chloroflexi bacterium]|nr:TfoX/Sxy family protein [Chloroflexota bacterium]
MTKEHLEELSGLLQRAVPRGLKSVKLECKHFFSGAAVYANGKICMTLTPAGFAMKLPEEPRSILMKHEGAKPLRYFPEGPIKKDYVVVPNVMLKDMKALKYWAKTSINYVTNL